MDIDEEPIPQRLKKVENGPLFAVKKASQEHEPIVEITNRSDVEG
jgi:hypothetical protein